MILEVILEKEAKKKQLLKWSNRKEDCRVDACLYVFEKIKENNNNKNNEKKTVKAPLRSRHAVQ